MAMNYAPTQALVRGMSLGSPASMQGGINQLLGMQNNNVNALTDTIGNVGKINRTNTVNDLIARGGLEGMTEQQAQQKLLGTAGGSLTDQGQSGVNTLLNSAGQQDQRNFNREEQRQRQEESRSVADKLYGRQVTTADTLATNNLNRDKIANTLKEHNVFKTITGKDGVEYGVRTGGQLVPLKEILQEPKTGSGSGKEAKYKPTGNIADVYKDSGAESKDVIEFFDNPLYNLQFKASVYKDDKGKVHKNRGEGQFFFNNKEVTIPELKKIKQITEENLKKG